MCEMLNSDMPPKTYESMMDWWVEGSDCQKGPDMPWMIQSLADEIEESSAHEKQREVEVINYKSNN